ncbi:Terminase small subunit [compost metagenome]
MTPEQQLLFDQLTQLQQRTATGVLAGMTQRAAYFAAGGKAADDDSADSSCSQILSNIKVKAFMDSMKVQAVNDAIMSRDEMLARLSLFARKGVKDIVKFKTAVIGKDLDTGEEIQQTGWFIPDSVLQNEDDLSIISELEVGKFGPKIKTHSSLQAMAQIAKLQGWEAASKHEFSGPDGGPIRHATELSDEALEKLALTATQTEDDE